MKAIEIAGHVDERHVLHLDQPLDLVGPRRVRVIVLVPDDEVSEAAWRQAAASNPAFGFLHDAAEDIYSPTDGKPLIREG